MGARTVRNNTHTRARTYTCVLLVGLGGRCSSACEHAARYSSFSEVECCSVLEVQVCGSGFLPFSLCLVYVVSSFSLGLF